MQIAWSFASKLCLSSLPTITFLLLSVLFSQIPFCSFFFVQSDESIKSPDNSAPETITSTPGPSMDGTTQADGPSKSDLFDKINAISLDEAQGDIVFTAVKKKKKKKKPKQSRQFLR